MWAPCRPAVRPDTLTLTCTTPPASSAKVAKPETPPGPAIVALAWIAPSLAAACVAINAAPPATVSPATATRTREEMVFMLVPPKEHDGDLRCGRSPISRVERACRFTPDCRFRQVTAVISRMSFTSAISPSTAMLNHTPRAIHVNAAGGGLPLGVPRVAGRHPADQHEQRDAEQDEREREQHGKDAGDDPPGAAVAGERSLPVETIHRPRDGDAEQERQGDEQRDRKPRRRQRSEVDPVGVDQHRADDRAARQPDGHVPEPLGADQPRTHPLVDRGTDHPERGAEHEQVVRPGEREPPDREVVVALDADHARVRRQAQRQHRQPAPDAGDDDAGRDPGQRQQHQFIEHVARNRAEPDALSLRRIAHDSRSDSVANNATRARIGTSASETTSPALSAPLSPSRCPTW